ncbi:hypothetical protein [Acinetobacter sp. YH12073]|uniref:hypothetical protein n=1 Tax=Acinetobacter sp. YH12073 TaxID=2601069 RepID=UPI0015D442D2|nr:hypothetical protein [Acinetobacter sp. YH12073]
MSDFITDVERQYEVYCEIAEEHGFIDLNAKKNGFRCTTKSNEFNAGWIAFVGAVAAVRDEQQARVDELQRRNQMLNDNIKEQGQKLVYQNEVIETQAEKLLGLRDEKAGLQKRVDAGLEKIRQFGKEGCLFPEWLTWAEKALRGAND